MAEAAINEIFDSIQGEGLYIGCRQVFVRFCGCNLLCDYCDTEFSGGDVYTPETLVQKINEFPLKSIHSISLTGGEPLLHYEFLKEFLPLVDSKTYLETNGVLYGPLAEVIDLIDIVSMDIKLDSSAKIGDLFNSHKKFLEIVKSANKEVFAKIVFDDRIADFEINECAKLGETFDIPLILQPKMNGNEIGVKKEKILEVFEKFTLKHPDTRLIGQVHKFYDIR